MLSVCREKGILPAKYIIETSHEKDSVALDNVRNLLGGKSRDFVTAVDEKNIIVVKELADKDGSRELEKMAKEMMEILRAESEDDKIHIAYGTVVNDIKEVSKSYKEAKLALDVGKIFFGTLKGTLILIRFILF